MDDAWNIYIWIYNDIYDSCGPGVPAVASWEKGYYFLFLCVAETAKVVIQLLNHDGLHIDWLYTYMSIYTWIHIFIYIAHSCRTDSERVLCVWRALHRITEFERLCWSNVERWRNQRTELLFRRVFGTENGKDSEKEFTNARNFDLF